MADYSLTQLSYFCAVAETGSFAAAAERRHVSATAIAAAVDRLEEAFQAQLCTRRRSKGVQLTTSGRLLYEEGIRVLRAAEEMASTVRGSGPELIGPINVGCFPNLAPTVVPRLLQAFAEQHPKVQLNFSIAALAELAEGAREGRLDCILSYTDLLPRDLDRAVLYSSSVFALVGSGNRFADRESVTLDELKSEPMILYKSDAADLYGPPTFGKHPLDFEIAFRTTQDELARALVAANLGFTLTILRTGSRVMQHPGCATVPVDTPWPQDSVAISWSGSIQLSARVRELIRVTKQLADNLEIG